MKLPPPNQHEIESALFAACERGDKEALAALLDYSPAQVSLELNPDYPDKKSKIYQALRWLWAAWMVSPQLGRRWLAIINTCARTWARRSLPAADDESICAQLAASVRTSAEMIEYAVRAREDGYTADELAHTLKLINNHRAELDALEACVRERLRLLEEVADARA